jgi:hypothetical protein
MGGDDATLSICGYLKITPTTISRSTTRREWQYETPYTIVESGTGSGWVGGTLRYWKLELDAPLCWRSRTIVFAIPSSVSSLDYLEFVELLDGKQSLYDDGHFHRSTEANRLTDSNPQNVPGATIEEKKRFLDNVPDDDPYLRELYQRALEGPDVGLRVYLAWFMDGPIRPSEAIAARLRLIANDPVSGVRNAAADQLNCTFMCVTAPDREDIDALEANLPMLIAAMANPEGQRHVVSVVDLIWCDLSEASRARLAPTLAGFYPYKSDDLLQPEIYNARCSEQEADAP